VLGVGAVVKQAMPVEAWLGHPELLAVRERRPRARRGFADVKAEQLPVGTTGLAEPEQLVAPAELGDKGAVAGLRLGMKSSRWMATR
jgi:hypothetical protein